MILRRKKMKIQEYQEIKNKEIEESSKSNLGDLIRTEIEEKED